MDNFTYHGLAKIMNVNIRKEKRGPEKKVLAVDLACEVRAPESICNAFDEDLHTLFFTETGEVKNKSLEPVRFDAKLKDCALEVSSIKFAGVTVTGFRLSPLPGRAVLMHFTAQFEPGEEDIGVLAETVQETVMVKVSAGGLPLEGGGRRKKTRP
jgi:hypothetical protein